MTTLKQIRADIGKLQREIRQVEQAVPPLAETEGRLRAYLEMLTNSHNRLIEHAAWCLNTGITSELTPAAGFLSEHSYGLAIKSIGIEAVIEAAKARATKDDDGRLRMSADDKADRLLELAHRLYTLEVEESGLLGDEVPRQDANAAAAVGIPADVAEQFGLLKGKV